MKYAYKLKINENANILEIDLKDELKFYEKYGKINWEGSNGNKGYKVYWKKLRKLYDGIHFIQKANIRDTKENIFKYEPLSETSSESSVFFKPVVKNIEKLKDYDLNKMFLYVLNTFRYNKNINPDIKYDILLHNYNKFVRK